MIFQYRLAPILGLLLCLARPATGQQETPTFVERVEVQLVNVEAWVTDDAGNPVRGLGIEDFEVFEDGEPVTVSYFAEVRGGEPARAPTLRSDLPAEIASEPPVGAGSPHLVLYFDELHLRAGGRKRLIADVRRFLDQGLVPPERVLILRQAESLASEAIFGSTREQLDAALERLSKPSAAAARSEQDKRLALDQLQQLWERARTLVQRDDPCDAFVRTASYEIDRYAQETRTRIGITLDHLSSVAGFLSGLPGVKTVLYLSDSLETGPGLDLLEFVEELCPVSQRENSLVELSVQMNDAFRRLTRHASANRVTLYTMQPEGLRAGAVSVAAQGTLDTRGIHALQTTSRMGERDGLTYLARETGGRAIFNSNRLDRELEQIGREMNSYYSLAYEPQHGGDRLEHEIEVRVRGKGLRVRHRKGYRDKSADDLMEERMQGALYLGLVSNPLQARLGAGDLQRHEKKGFVLPFHVMVPVESLVFVPDKEGARANLKVLLTAHDHRGVRRAFEERSFRVVEPQEEATELIDLVFELDLEQGLYTVVVGLRDETSRDASFVSTTVELLDPEDPKKRASGP